MRVIAPLQKLHNVSNIRCICAHTESFVESKVLAAIMEEGLIAGPLLHRQPDHIASHVTCNGAYFKRWRLCWCYKTLPEM